MEWLMMVGLGIVLILIGLSNRKGKINSLHSYHRKRVSEQNRLPFGKLVGTGTMMIGTGLIVAGALTFAGMSETVQESVILTGFVPGIGIICYAMFKYNKGIF
jgi:hypothetical protein